MRIGTNAIEFRDLERLNLSVYVAVVSTILFLILDVWVKIYRRKLENVYEQDVQEMLVSKLVDIKLQSLKAFNVGDAITNVINNANDAVHNTVSYFFDLCSGVGAIVIGVVYMGLIEWRLMLCIVIYNICLRIIMTVAERAIKDNSKKSMETLKENNSFLIKREFDKKINKNIKILL